MNTFESLRKLIESCLEEPVRAGEIAAGEIDAVYKLIKSAKLIDDIMMGEGGMSHDYSGRMSRESGGSYGRSYDRSYDRSYARRRDSMGRYMDSGYSGADDMVSKLHRLMEDAQNDREREAIRKCLESM